MRKYTLEIIIFISGAVVMIFELAGSRVLAPYLGTSLTVWTSLIGIILGSLSIGYFTGGKLADKYLSFKILSLMFLAAAILVGLTAVFKDWYLGLIIKAGISINLSSVLASLGLFTPASICLGMVSPYAIRLKLENIEKSGGTVGRMYAISTAGSIVGTFAAGFYLIPFIGTSNIIYLISAALVICALAISAKHILFIKSIFLALVLSGYIFSGSINPVPGPGGVFDIDTKYNRFFINDRYDLRRPVRTLRTDPFGTQAAIYFNDPDTLVFDYLKAFALIDNTLPAAENNLLIGGGVYTFPRNFIKRKPDSTIDVVEIDDELLRIARDYFYYEEDSRIKIFHEDGRIFLNRNEKKYDRIFVDAFNSHVSIPFHLTTREAVGKIYDSLFADGVVMVNIISAINGDRGKFLRAELATYKEFFPEVFIFQAQTVGRDEEKQNLILIAVKEGNGNNGDILDKLANLYKGEISLDIPVLTDDHAPVDYYTNKFLN